MKECEKRINTLLPLEHDIKTIMVQEKGFQQGWRAALEYALEARPKNHFGTAKANCVQVSWIEKELEEEPSTKKHQPSCIMAPCCSCSIYGGCIDERKLIQ